jgi:hypothetical protein
MPKPPVDFANTDAPPFWAGSTSTALQWRRRFFLAFAVFFVVGFAVAYWAGHATR